MECRWFRSAGKIVPDLSTRTVRCTLPTAAHALLRTRIERRCGSTNSIPLHVSMPVYAGTRVHLRRVRVLDCVCNRYRDSGLGWVRRCRGMRREYHDVPYGGQRAGRWGSVLSLPQAQPPLSPQLSPRTATVRLRAGGLRSAIAHGRTAIFWPRAMAACLFFACFGKVRGLADVPVVLALLSLRRFWGRLFSPPTSPWRCSPAARVQR